VAPLRVAVVGAGRMGRVHLRALAAAPSLTAVAVVDPVAEAITGLGDVAAYPTVDDLVAAGGFDAAVIAAPTGLHVPLVSALAAAGVPMLCEKPCGLVASDARAAGAAAEAAGVLLQIGYWRRFVPELVELRARIRAGELGEIAVMSCWQWDESPPPASFRSHSGGIAIDMAVHEFDCARWMLEQEIDSVVAVGSQVGESAPGDPDCAEMLAALSGGSVAHVSLGRHFEHGDSCWVEIMGTLGHARSRFMWGAEGERAFVGALVAQAEAFASGVCDGRLRGAGARDAEAALAAAEVVALR
jgi:myo-inositol 2-dehydrogenase / D-chiro-inositol 1-dehydrogenase